MLSGISGLALAVPPELHQLHEQVNVARQQGKMDEADQLARDYLAFANQQPDVAVKGKAYFSLGQNAMARNNYPEAKKHLEQAISLFRSTSQPTLLADAFRQLGLTYRYQTDYTDALKYLYQAMRIYKTEKNLHAIASTYGSIGATLEKMGQYEAALQAHQQALQLHKQLSNQAGIASAIYNLGDLNRTLGDQQKALNYFLQSLALDLASGDPRDIAYSHNKLGYLYSESGEFSLAATHLKQALTLFEQVAAPRDADWTRTIMAKLAMEQGDYPQAQQLLDGVIKRATSQGYKSLLVDAYKLAAPLAIKQGDYQAAHRYIEAGVLQARQNRELADEAQMEKQRAEVLIVQDRVREALAALQHQNKLEAEVFNTKRVAAIGSMQAQVDFTRQQHQIELLEQQQRLQQAVQTSALEQHRLERNFWILGLATTFALIFMLYHRRQQKRQTLVLSAQVAARTAELHQKNAELQAAYQQLETISLTDKLTGLYNRHFIESHIDSELEHCLRLYQDWQAGITSKPEHADMAVLLIDLDRFKQLNDNYGHNAGDEVLQQLKHNMQQVFRQSDYLVRWGGEEFVVVVRFIERADVQALAQRFIESVQQTPFVVTGQPPIPVTCSVGYVCYPLVANQHNCQWPELLKLADLCLYAAKNSGRNGWIGMQDYAVDLPVPPLQLSAQDMQDFHRQSFINLQHSFSGELHWQKP